MNKELEEAIKELRILSILGLGCNITEEIKQKFETILNYIDNSISKEVVEKKIAELTEEYELLLEHQSGQKSNRTKYLRGKIHMCQELLEEK